MIPCRNLFLTETETPQESKMLKQKFHHLGLNTRGRQRTRKKYEMFNSQIGNLLLSIVLKCLAVDFMHSLPDLAHI